MAKKERLDKVLSNLGYGTRTEIKKYLKYGIVTVNGEIIKNASTHIDPENDEIIFDGEKVNYRKYIYIMLNKPKGYISATYDDVEKTVIDIIDPEYRIFNPFPVGRLDKDTEGLLVLTNDGQLSHRILSPKRHVPKVYYAHIQGVVTEDDVKAFSEGVVLDDGYKTMPSHLKILKSNDISEIEVKIYEGKYHQVKRMFESVGKKVIYLKRISMGKLKLDENLALGEYRELTEEEVKLLEERE
ncbi:16S rRNA pseudouridine516 synthase [Alkalithermobacter thermoalcaliphilus JW-YL-7 = DSM 7308]|uniref:Pseudouridine synthase n=1 Tax=Alkalithermobacter thermoalcaliphilus JW-YL-7 = DSM 7308 TaxID=1121328 RepID=A0A150FNM7_CLOPD|nr:pseudouridine synthase Rsu [[Clostridium] paradoxum JW-YL-7 = DSM 7308]SHK92824.1 16S rRNA pseudouridine516 synthase [[Clostridium] paradoxum JW-YL-7 = DSM 7308]